MSKFLPLLALLAASASAGIYSSSDGYTFLETALLHGFSHSGAASDTTCTIKIATDGRIVDSTSFSLETLTSPGD